MSTPTKKTTDLDAPVEFKRFNIHMRIQHALMASGVIILVITGMPLKFPHFIISEWLMHAWGGVSTSSVIHRVGASLLITSSVYHLVYTFVHPQGRKDFLLLLPTPKDAFDAFQKIRLYLGLTDKAPRFGRFGYVEKFDYWAVYWGSVIVVGSGALLWGQETALKYLPKYMLDVAHVAHSDEALLATLAIIFFHFYNVHLNPTNFPGSLTWWHGKVDEHHMKEHHGLEYDRIMKDRAAK